MIQTLTPPVAGERKASARFGLALSHMAHRRSISAFPKTIRRKLSSMRASTQHHVDTSSHHQPVDTPPHGQPITMEETDNVVVTRHPSELLRHVAASMSGRHEEISVTVPRMTTWKTVLRAVESALGEVDGQLMITKERTRSQRERMRQIALENVQYVDSMLPRNPIFGHPIRTQYDTKSLPSPKPASKETIKRLKDDAMPFMPFRQPYPVTLHAAITEKRLPLVKASANVDGVDAPNERQAEQLKLVDMIWDTGAHQTYITEDVFSDSFRQYLQDPIHDQYRSKDGVRVQMSAVIALSNTSIEIDAIVWVVPKGVLPNELSGILFGQQQCIDRLHHRSIPRRILNAKGEDVDEGLWGDIVLEEYVDEDGNIHSF